jgi:hypothetical protein
MLNTGVYALPSSQDAAIQSVARARPGSYWIIGSEPNVPGQAFDSSKSVAENAAEYATTFRRYRALVLAADSSARFVVGNTLNLDANCGGCGGYPAGRGFLDAFVAAYGEPIPADTLWGMHAYRIDWSQLPMVDTSEPKRELAAFRSWVDGQPGQAGKAIWLTEFGVVWGYPSLCLQDGKVSNCGASFSTDAVDSYLAGLTDWLTSNGPSLKVERWFVFSSYAQPEAYASVAAGIALMDGSSASAQLTRFGQSYAARARPTRR